MNNERSFQKLAGIAAILSAPLGIASLVLVIAPLNFNFEAFENTALFLTAGESGATTLRWSMILDIFGFYLLLAPAAFVLWQWLKPKGPARVGFYTFCGLAYILLGSAGAAILSAVWPPLVSAYAQGPSEAIEVVFVAITNGVIGGIWNTLDPFTSGVWWLGIGLLLRSERRALGMYTVILGVVTLLSGVGAVIGAAAFAALMLNFFLLMAPIWALWLGIDLLRKPVV